VFCAPLGALVVVQEIFGVNAHMRSVVDAYAAVGYVAVAPAFFDPVERGVELGYDEAGFARGRELVAALAGENAHRIRFIDPASPFINADGELLDRWQVPLFFHFVEADDVGVRSAGPDRVLWTADDVMMGEHAVSE
jgi:dienelactone hydrolase